MLTRYEHGGIVWIDLETPTAREVQDIAAERGIAPLVAEELLLPSTKPRIEFHETYAYVILHFPALRQGHKSQEQEIDFVIGRDFLITTHYDTIDPLHKFSKVFEVNSVLDKSTLGEHAGYVFFYMLKKMYRSIEHEIEYLRQDLSLIEENIFSGREVDMVSIISQAARDLLKLRQTIEPHREVLHALEAEGTKFFGEDFAPYLRALSNEYYRVHNHVMRHTDFLHELRETNNSLLTTKQNETIKTLTIMAFIILPLSFIAELFAMGARYEPIIGSPYDFWIIFGIMCIVGLSIILFFKSRKWL